MPKLENPRHEHFCQQYVKTQNQTESYRKAYGDKKTAEVSASKLIRNTKVAKRIKELQEKAGERVSISIDNVLMFADRVRQKCMGSSAEICPDTGNIIQEAVKPDYTNALKANDQIARIIGAYNDNLNITNRPKTLEQTVREAWERENDSSKEDN